MTPLDLPGKTHFIVYMSSLVKTAVKIPLSYVLIGLRSKV